MQNILVPIVVVLLIVFIIQWIKPDPGFKVQNILLLLASYTCYAFWDWRFLILIIVIAIFNFITGNAISDCKDPGKKKLYLILSIVLHIGFIGLFRYYNFFIESLIKGFSMLGTPLNINTLKLVVPLGISIYTLQAISYTFDIYRQKIQPTNDLIAFLAYVSFFPQMFAGPIERATTLLPQYSRERQINLKDSITGFRRIIWGVFKILVIANNLAVYSNEVFANYSDYTGLTIFAGLVSFAFQFYAYLSGLSDIAIGSARLFGIVLNTNFRFPYFSTGLNDFWSKWNISLMEWLKEYVYNPLGGSSGKLLKVFRNLFVLFLLTGLWYGGNISFILFGLINAIILLPTSMNQVNKGESFLKISNKLPGLVSIIGFLITSIIVIVGLTFFRADSSSDAINILKNLSVNLFSISINELRSLGNGLTASISNLAILMIYILIEWFQRRNDFALDFESKETSVNKKWFLTILVLILILFFHQTNQEFTYFSF